MDGLKNYQRDESWNKRLQGLISDEVFDKTVMIIGCGSVGSFVACELVRSGIRNLIFVDPDIVENPNLTRTMYVASDIGKFKCDSLKKHCLSIFPDLNIDVYNQSIQEVDLTKLINQSDLIVSAVDDPSASNLINYKVYPTEKPLVYIGLYRGAKGGEVIVVKNNSTPCYQCSTGGIRESVSETNLETVDRDVNYGTNKLVSEVALGSDIHFVCCAAIKIIISLLSIETSLPIKNFSKDILGNNSNYLILGMDPNYFLFPTTHQNAVGQYAFQSIWVQTESRAECYICSKQRDN